MTPLLIGKTVLVTAAAGAGIGFATALRCAQEGADVVLSDINEDRLSRAAAQLEDETGSRAATMLCDVRDTNQVDDLVRFADGRGGLDVLINNAGLGDSTTIRELSDDRWAELVDVNLSGCFRCLRAAMEAMEARGAGGTIVNVSSVTGWRAQAGQAAYAASKAGVMALTRVAAMEGADASIRVNAVAPSFAEHPHLLKVMSREEHDRLRAAEPFGRGAKPAEIANVILFLASDLSSYLTGEVVSASSQHP